MVYDPAWSMPKLNWQQQGSFEQGLIPLVDEPDAEPLVCLPSINVHWLPLVLGCLDQLRNPSTWIASNDAAMSAVLSKVMRLMQMVGDRSECVCTLVRLQDCQLQTSCDGGTTWTTVPGWDPGFAECVQEQIPVIGLPPNPGDETHNQLACSIAAYLADEIIKASIQQAVTNITDDLTLLAFGAEILTIIPEFILVGIAYDAFGLIYTAIQEGTLSDYSDALADDTLWANITCAIYQAIYRIGYVTPANFPAIIANIAAVSYVHSDVIDTIVSYVTELGATGLAQLSQRAGLNIGADCSTCVTEWCYRWDADGTTGNMTDWLSGPDAIGTFVPGVGLQSVASGGNAVLIAELFWTDTFITLVGVDYTCAHDADTGTRGFFHAGVEQATLESGTGNFSTTITPELTWDGMAIVLETSSSTLPNTITTILIHGTGDCPFTGGPNCDA